MSVRLIPLKFSQLVIVSPFCLYSEIKILSVLSDVFSSFFQIF